MNKKLRLSIKVSVVLLLFLVIAFVACYLLTNGTYTVPLTVESNPTLTRVFLNGYTFHAETFGKAANPVVVILHGGPGADYRYLYPLKDLASEYFLVFFDQRGTGLSPRVPAAEISLEVYYQDLDAFVGFFGNGRPVNIIGHSWGAMLASGYACRFPRKVNKLVLAEPGFLRGEMAGPATKRRFNFKLLYRIGKSWFQSLHMSKKQDAFAANDYFLGQLLNIANGAYNCKDMPVNAKKSKSSSSWRAGYVCWDTLAGQLMRDDEYRNAIDFTIGVEDFKKKVLFITGKCNQVIGERHQREQMKYFPNAELVVIEDAGHYMFNDKPKESLAVIRKYFKEKSIINNKR